MNQIDTAAPGKTTGTMDKTPNEAKKKKRKALPEVRYGSGTPSAAAAGESGTAAAIVPRPSYSDVMGQYYAGRYAEELAENRRIADTAAESAERDAQAALRRLRDGYKATDRQLYREYMESRRTLPQRLAAQGITGGLTESSQVRLANSYGEMLAENERARLGEEAETYSQRDARLAAASAEQSRADAAARRAHGENLAKLRQEAEAQRRENAAKIAALLAAAGDYSGYLDLGLTQEQADYLAEVWMGKNGKTAPLRRAWNGTTPEAAPTPLYDGSTDAAVERVAALLAAGAISGSEAEELWKLLRIGSI